MNRQSNRTGCLRVSGPQMPSQALHEIHRHFLVVVVVAAAAAAAAVAAALLKLPLPKPDGAKATEGV